MNRTGYQRTGGAWWTPQLVWAQCRMIKQKTFSTPPTPTPWNRATIVQPLSCYLHSEVSVLPEHFQTQKSIEELYSVCNPPHFSAKHGYHQALHKHKYVEKNAMQWKVVKKI